MQSARIERVAFRSCSKCGTKIPQTVIQNCPVEYPCGNCGQGANTAKIVETKTRLIYKVGA